MEKDMNIMDWMQEKIEMYCDADRRGRIDADDAKRYCPTIEEALKAMA